MYTPHRRILTSFAIGLVALLPVACSSSGGGGGGAATTSSLSSPVPGRVYGNWLVVGSSIRVIKDTGATHDMRDGDTFRIGGNGVEVIAGAYVLAGGVSHRLTLRVGGVHELTTLAQIESFTAKLLVDTSAANNEPRGTDYLQIDCTGMVVGSQLEIHYVLRVFEAGKEVDVDELSFVCGPGPAVPADMTGRWAVSNVRVIEDTGPKHFLDSTSVIEVQGDKVASVLSLQFTMQAVANSLGKNYQLLDLYSKAELGRVEGMLLAVGLTGTPAEGNGQLLTFDLVHTGTRLQGGWFFLEVLNLVENIDDLEITLLLKQALRARLPEDNSTESTSTSTSTSMVDQVLPAQEKKLFEFVNEAMQQQRDRR